MMIPQLLAAISTDGLASGGIVAVAMGAIQVAVIVAKKRNGEPPVNGQARICREHGERLASLETMLPTLCKGQDTIFEKVDGIDRKLTDVIAEQRAAAKQQENNRP